MMKTHAWHPFTPLRDERPVLRVESGRGALLRLSDGRTLVDGISSWWVNLHGHARPEISRAIARQASRLEQVIFAGFTHAPAEALAARLCRVLPGPMHRIFFSDDGSTSVEVAIKIAFQYWFNRGAPRRTLLALEGAYHGDTFGAMSAGARGLFTKPFDRHLFRVVHLPFPSPAALPRALARMKSEIAKGQVAAFLYEPLVQGAGGMRMYPAASLRALMELAKASGVLCIADEVMTGFGRTGTLFASQQALPMAPDLVCLSKGLTGGFLPMGITAASKHVFDAFTGAGPEAVFWHGHSYTANPLACAAALASLEILLGKASERNRLRVADTFARWLPELSSHPMVLNARQTGCILAFEVKTPRGGYLSPAKKKMERAFLREGVLLRPLGNTVYVLPPYVITQGQLDLVRRALLRGLEAAERLQEGPKTNA